MDSQIVELLGRQRLIAELLASGLEVALPIRDRGIDLLAYADTGDGVDEFKAFPIQLKASTGSAFSIDRKYEKFPNLIIAFVWRVEDVNAADTFAMTHSEALQISSEMGYLQTRAWERGSYVSTRPSSRLLHLMTPYRTSRARWRKLVSPF